MSSFPPPPGQQPPGFGQPIPPPTGGPMPPPPPGGPMPPAVTQGGFPGTGPAMLRRSPAGVWLLSMVTFGIYFLIWYYKVQKEMREFDPRVEVNPTKAVLIMIFGSLLLFIPPLISFYNTGKRVAQVQRAAGLAQTCSRTIGFSLFIPLGAMYYQEELNKVNEHYGSPPPGTHVPLAA